MITLGLILMVIGLGFMLVAAGGARHVKRKRTSRAIHSVRRAYPNLDPDDKLFKREVQNLLRRRLK